MERPPPSGFAEEFRTSAFRPVVRPTVRQAGDTPSSRSAADQDQRSYSDGLITLPEDPGRNTFKGGLYQQAVDFAVILPQKTGGRPAADERLSFSSAPSAVCSTLVPTTLPRNQVTSMTYADMDAAAVGAIFLDTCFA